MDSAGLTRKQVELVLRRAAELEQTRGGDGDDVTAADVERIGTEAGLSRDAIQRALAEMDSGALTLSRRNALDRVLGPEQVVAERSVRGPLDQVRTLVRGYLDGQLMRVRRDYGDRVVWERAEGFWFSILRAVDWSRRYRLPDGVVVESSVVPHPRDGRDVLVRLVAETRASRRGQALGAGLGSLAGAAIVASTLMFVPSGHLIGELVGLTAGGGLAGGWIVGARSTYRRMQSRLREELERFLDTLEHP